MITSKKSSLPLFLVIGLIIAFFIRLLLIPNPGFEADVSFWKSWGLAVVDFGLVKGLRLTNFNYPSPFGYFLFLMVKTYSLFADPHNFNEFWKNNNLWFLFVAKIPAIIADFGVAGVLYWFGSKFQIPNFKFQISKIGTLLALLYLFNPISIMDGAWWGQIDSIGVLLFLSAFVAVLKNKPFWAGVIFMIAMMTKLQNMIYGPLFFLFLWQYLGFEALVKAISGTVLAFIGLNIEYVLARDFRRVIESIIGNYDYFPWLSLNAFNPWWIAAGARGMEFSDKILAIGIINAKTVGLIFFSGGYLYAILRLLTLQKASGGSGVWHFAQDDKRIAGPSKMTYAANALTKTFLESLIIVAGSFFLFQTESHDRYAFPIIIFALLWAPLWLQDAKHKLSVFCILYAVFSILYFYNLHTALVFNYPQNGIPILHTLTQPAITLTISYIFTGFFLWLLLYFSRNTKFISLCLPIIFIVGAITIKNMPLITKKPVYLTAITPISYYQGYGRRQVNMPVDAFEGFHKWGSLSVQYTFYRHGIGTHAKSAEVYDIGGLFKTFSFDYGIDTNGGPQGTVTFEVWGDGKLLFASKKIGRYDLPRHAEVGVQGIKKLELRVTDAGDGITDDHADWLNPILTPR